jgi:hypothetical protein
MGWFSKPRETEKSVYEPTEEEYQNYMAGYRLGFPVEEDQPAILRIDPNEPLFRRGLTDGMRTYQENQEFLAERPVQNSGGFFGWFRR